MKPKIIIILTVLTLKTYAQLEERYVMGYNHNSQFINPHGDTLNKVDNAELYEGVHVLTKAKNNLYNDTISFLIGKFIHGKPVGEWKDHCKDGTYSSGGYSMGPGELWPDPKGGWIEKMQGIYLKIGTWKYFDKDNHLLKTKRYDHLVFRHSWTDREYIADSTGKFILTRFESMSNYSTKRRKEIKKIYTNKGVPVSAEHKSFWKTVFYEYDKEGHLSKIRKPRKFFGRFTTITIVKEYNSKGQLKCKTKANCKHPDLHIEKAITAKAAGNIAYNQWWIVALVFKYLSSSTHS